LEHPSFENSVSRLAFALGRDVAGNPTFADLARMPHLLVAGSTGTGKTICLNTIILSLLFRNSPDTLRVIAIDPKRVEFSIYADLPHLLTPIIFDAQKTINALKWLVAEMERRFEVLSDAGSKNIASYNDKIAKQSFKEGEMKPSPLPYIVLIVDELADLMAARGREIEALIVRLAQMSRAVGIHLILATQRPSVEVITGLIKANITSRITFQVASQVDSRTILDVAGAEKLLGAGDLLFISSESSKPRRMQGAFISEKETKKVVEFILKADKEQEKPETEKGDVAEDELAASAKEILDSSEGQNGMMPDNGNGGDDALYEEAKKIVIQARKASASLLQRRLRLGYARAARLIDMLEDNGVVGPGEGAKPREVYADNAEQEIGGDLDLGGGASEDVVENQEVKEESNEDVEEESGNSENEEEEDDGYVKL
jgi:S-DNA-T family DNA segregation ATPase FtsK/SpoIIIE